jgi:hypothetical protein
MVSHLGGKSGLKNSEQVVYKQSRKIIYSARDTDTVDEDENEDEDKELVVPLSNF